MISEYISKLEQKIDLTYDQMSEIMSEVLSGKTNDEQNVSFYLIYLRRARLMMNYWAC